MKGENSGAVITGAGSGVGRGLCLELARSGYGILALDRDLAAVQETIGMLPKAAAADAYQVDVTCASEIENFQRAILERAADQPISLLVNNAGLQHVAPLDEFPQEKWSNLVEVMLGGSAAMTRAVLPHMRQQGFGRIINIGSIHSLVASPYKTAYVAAKHGLLGFSKALALETADTDITVNTICPSYIRTPLVEKQITDQAKHHGMTEEEVIEKIMLAPMPKGAFITIEEIAGAILFLAGPHARNITGQTITIDGGWTAR